MKKSVKRIIQKVKHFRLIGYVVIGVSLWKLEQDINSLILKMFFLILFTELGSRGTSKTKIETLKDDFGIDDTLIVEYEDKEKLRVKSLHKQEKEDIEKVNKEIKEHYIDKL